MHNPAVPRFVVIGSLNVDLTTVVNQLPRAGETLFGHEFHLGFGGKGGNQAAAARLCGADVSIVARLGEDLFGPATIQDLAKFGIDTEHVSTTPGASSGVAPIFVDSSGQNRILVVKGANDLLSPKDIDAAFGLIETADVVILQLEVPLENGLSRPRRGAWQRRAHDFEPRARASDRYDSTAQCGLSDSQ